MYIVSRVLMTAVWRHKAREPCWIYRRQEVVVNLLPLFRD